MAGNASSQQAASRFAPVQLWVRLFHKALDHGWWFVVLMALIFATLGIFWSLLSKGWAFGFLLVPFYGFGIYAGIRDLVERRLSVRQAFGAIALMTVLSAAIAAAASEMLRGSGSAIYTAADPVVESVRFEHLLLFYLWMTLDLVPAMEITNWLNVTQPVKVEGQVAGIPVILFRGFMLLVLFKVVTNWWTGRDRRVAPAAGGAKDPSDVVGQPP